jgi:NADH-ubiquinone oxidoreductase chain 5
MMVVAVGLSQYNVALMHLVLHAAYKAGLFLAAGSIIHAMNDQQDFRRFGGLVQLLPLTYQQNLFYLNVLSLTFFLLLQFTM